MNFLLIYTNQFQLMRDPGIKNFRAGYNLFLAKELTLFLFHVPMGLTWIDKLSHENEFKLNYNDSW